MATFTVTATNWNDAAFWAGVSADTSGQVLEFDSLDDSYSVVWMQDHIILSQGATSFLVGDSTYAGVADATMTAGSELGYFDEVLGVQGDDIILGGTGDDTLNGNDGDDFLQGDDGWDLLNGQAGQDTLTGGKGNDTLQGGDDQDLFIVGDQDDVETIVGGSGGTDHDTIRWELSDTTEGVEMTFTGDGTGFYNFLDATASGWGSFSEIEKFEFTEYGESIDAEAVTEDQMFDFKGGDDTVRSGAGNDTLIGGLGDDSLFGGVGIDSVSGGIGDDALYGGTGTDTLEGGLGHDSLFGDEDSDTILGGDGNDTVEGGTGDDYVVGGADDDSMNGDYGNDTISGGAGNDFVRGSYGNDVLSGGTGDDYVWGGWGDDTLIVEDNFGNDTYSAENVDQVLGDTLDLSAVTSDLTFDLSDSNPETGVFTDGVSVATYEEVENLVLGSGTNTLVLADQSGADVVEGFKAPSSLGEGKYSSQDLLDVTNLFSDGGTTPVTVDDVTVGDDGSGNAVLSFPGGETITLLGVSPDAVSSPVQLAALGIPSGVGPVLDYIVEGTSGDDTIDLGYTGDPDGDRIDNNDHFDAGNADSVVAGAGADVVSSRAGNDTIDAGEGADSVRSGTGDDSVQGGDGNDTLLGSSGADTLSGGADADSLDSGDGADELNGDDGEDILLGGLGSDTLSGGADADHLDGGDDADELSGNDGNDTLLGGQGADTLSGGADADSLDGGDGADELNGDDGEDILLGGLGSDTLSGGADADSLDGGDDADELSGNDGNDTLLGGQSADTLSGGADADSLDGGDGADELNGDDGEDILLGGSGADTLSGGADADSLDGGDDADVLGGGDGRDIVLGGAGEDNLSGGGESDSLDGGDDADVLNGGAGDDTLQGGLGADKSEGGDGDDVFLLSADFGADTIAGGEGGETAGDTLDLSKLTSGVTLNLTGSDPESGSVSDGNATAVFEEIETIRMGGGRDTVVLADGSGDDQVTGFDVSDSGDGTGMDQLDLAGLTSDGWTTPVTVDDVTVGDDGSGNAVLSFPGGETITLLGVSPDAVSSPVQLAALGIPSAVGSVLDYIVEGTSGDDTIDLGYTGDPDGDRIDNNDHFDAGNADSVVAGAGADVVSSGVGNDTIDAGEGADSVISGTGDDSVQGGDGNDTLLGSSGADTLSGGADADSLDGGDGADELNGDDGEDTLLGGLGSDTLSGGADADSLDGGDDADELSGNDGNDTLLGGQGADTLSGGADADSLDGGDDADELSGNDGNDTLLGGQSADTLSGGADADSLDGGDGADELNGDDGEDILLGGLGSDTLSGGADADHLDGGDGADVLGGGAGDDILQGGLGADNLSGGAGDDTFTVSGDQLDDDTITGGETGELEGDTLDLRGISADLTVTMSGPEAGTVAQGDATLTFSEIETLFLDGGDDNVTGSSEDDTIFGGSGADTVNAGAGNDQIDLGFGDTETDVVVLTDGFGDDSVGNFLAPVDNGDGSYTGGDLLDVTGLQGADGAPVDTDDVTVGDSNNDGSGHAVLSFPNGETITLIGVHPSQVFAPASLEALGIPGVDNVALNNLVEGTSGDDVIDADYFGDPEGDRVDNADNATGTDDDFILAGAGDDNVAAGEGRDIVSAGEGNDTVAGGNDADTLLGEAGNDSLTGGDGDDAVLGGADDDSLTGNGGSDTLHGEAGDDELDGGSGNDTMTGGDGRDSLQGGAGDDSLHGGADQDVFSVGDGAGTDTIVGGEGVTDGVDFDQLDATDITGPVVLTYSDDEAGLLTDGNNSQSFTEIEDVLLGDGGNTVVASGQAGGISVSTGAGADTVTGGEGNDTVLAGDGADSVTGGQGADQLFGEDGEDTLTGGDGDDTLSGGDDADSLTAGDGDDVLDGGSGADTLHGGAGADTVAGGAGNDMFSLGSGDSATGGDGDDVFNVGPDGLTGAGLTLDGGDTGETLGDTLNITGPAAVQQADGSGTVTWLDGSTLTFSNIENITYTACFTAGCRITTVRGEVPVEEIIAGDLVLTRDKGFQPVTWAGGRAFTGTELAQNRGLAPIRIKAGALGQGMPQRDLVVSPQHRVLISDTSAGLWFGEDEVLVAAKDLTVLQGIQAISPQEGVHYVHFMFEDHQIVVSDGAWTESFQPGDISLHGLDQAQRREICEIFPELETARTGSAFPPARYVLKAYQARVLFSRRPIVQKGEFDQL